MSAVVLLPEVMVMLAAIGALAAIAPRGRRRPPPADEDLEAFLAPVLAAVLVVALGLELWLGASVGSLFGGGYHQDRFALFTKAAILIALLLAVAAADWSDEASWLVLPMLLLTGFGGMVVASGGSLVALWAGFQLSASAAAVAVASRHREHGLRLLLAAALSGSLLATGFAHLYATAGVASLDALKSSLGPANLTLSLAVAVTLSLAGVALGLLLAPFQLPALGAYRGASPIGAAATGGLAVVCAGVVGIKLAAALINVEQAWAPFMAVLAALAMLIGALTALSAATPRALALGLGVAQAGWIAAGLAAHDAAGLAAAAYLLAAFAAASVAAPVLMGPAEAGFNGLRNLSDRQPALAAGLGVALLSLAGAPPLAGFFGEFTVAVGLISANLGWLVGAGLLSAVVCLIACGRALRLLFLEPVEEPGRRRSALYVGSGSEALRHGAGVAVALLLASYGLFANPIHGLAVQGAAALGLR